MTHVHINEFLKSTKYENLWKTSSETHPCLSLTLALWIGSVWVEAGYTNQNMSKTTVIFWYYRKSNSKAWPLDTVWIQPIHEAMANNTQCKWQGYSQLCPSQPRKTSISTVLAGDAAQTSCDLPYGFSLLLSRYFPFQVWAIGLLQTLKLTHHLYMSDN